MGLSEPLAEALRIYPWLEEGDRIPCLCRHACVLGGPCCKVVSAEDLLCDDCRDAPLHCHALGEYTLNCSMEEQHNE